MKLFEAPQSIFYNYPLCLSRESHNMEPTQVRTFPTGATRSPDDLKHHYDGYLSPRVIKRFGEYMTKHRVQSDGSLRDPDNWQKGMPQACFIDSGWRHFLDWWMLDRGGPVDPGVELEDTLCALMFNVMGYLHEHLKKRQS